MIEREPAGVVETPSPAVGSELDGAGLIWSVSGLAQSPVRRPIVVTSPALTLVTAGAMILIVLSYLVGQWVELRGGQLGFLEQLNRWVGRPLGVGEDFGPLGIMLLLLAAGYAIPSSARIVRIGAIVAVGTLMAYALGASAWTVPGERPISSDAFLANLTLVSHVLPGTTLLLPLAWVVLLAFGGWLCSLAVKRLPRRLRWLGYLTELVLIIDVVAVAGNAPQLERLGVVASFYPLFVVGQVVRGVRARVLPAGAGILLACVAFAAVVLAEQVLPPNQGWWYPLAMAYAGLLFAIAVTFAGRTAAAIASNPVVRGTAERAWYYVVFIGAVGHPLASALASVAPVAVALPIAVVGTAVAVEIAHRLMLGIQLAVRGRGKTS